MTSGTYIYHTCIIDLNIYHQNQQYTIQPYNRPNKPNPSQQQSSSITPIFSPIVERTNREIGRCLRTHCSNQQKNWVDFNPLLNECLNTLHHTTTGYNPQELHLNTTPTWFWHKYFLELTQTNMDFNLKLHITSESIAKYGDKHTEKFNESIDYTNFRKGIWFL